MGIIMPCSLCLATLASLDPQLYQTSKSVGGLGHPCPTVSSCLTVPSVVPGTWSVLSCTGVCAGDRGELEWDTLVG